MFPARWIAETVALARRQSPKTCSSADLGQEGRDVRHWKMGRLNVLVMRGTIWGAIIPLLCVVPATALAIDPGVVIAKPQKQPEEERKNESVCAKEAEPILQSYEPLTGSYTHDSNDTGFLDINLSLKIRLLPWCWTPSSVHVHPYFAMATRFGFYWGSRHDSPVIGKSYNPLLLFRFLLKQDTTNKDKKPAPDDGSSYERADYIDLIPYAHQSNGQLIHTQQEYDDQLKSLLIPSYTNNFIHRGWDYTGIVWKKSWTSSQELATYLEGRYFIPVGFLQGPEDQYHSWEMNPQGKPREAVDGLSATAQFPTSYAYFVVEPSAPECRNGNSELQFLKCMIRPNITMKYATGYDTPFKYSTERVELGFQVGTLPLALWVQHGYMSSLAMYYEKVTSIGMEVRFETL
jgi:hypothetical protein